MEDVMKEIMFLCVRYHEMYMMERAVRNCEDMSNYETLSKAYELDKQIFDEQYSKVEKMIHTYNNGGIVGDEWMVYDCDSDKLISVHKSMRSAKQHKNKLWNSNEYNCLGMEMKSEWDKIHSASYAKGGLTENLEKELRKLQRDLNSSRLRTYREGDNSEEEMARRREREVKLSRFNEVLKLLRERDSKYAKGGGVNDIKYKISYLSKKHGFRQVDKVFEGKDAYDDAVKWGRKNLENFNLDMIRYVPNDSQYENGGGVDFTFEYQMLDRLRLDNDAYLDGVRAENRLWAGNVDSQIQEMKRLWNIVPEKPEWLSMEDILEYERKMKSEYENGGRVSKVGYTVNVYHGGEMDDESLYAATLDEAKKLAQIGEHSEIIDNSTNQEVSIMKDGGVSDLQFTSKTLRRSIESKVRANIFDGEIPVSLLKSIIGHEPDYPVQFVGSLKLTKSFLRPYYKI